jgi:chitin synthase
MYAPIQLFWRAQNANMAQIYSLALVFWLPRNMLERVQYILGYIMHIIVGPIINLFIFLYSIYYSDDFKWGKTREVIGGDEEHGRLCHQ